MDRGNPDPSTIRGRRWWVCAGTDLVDGADCGMIVTAATLTEAVSMFIGRHMVGDVLELSSGELPEWHNWVQSLAAGRIRLPRPSSGAIVGRLHPDRSPA